MPPFEGRLVDGYIYGRGTLDDKHSLMVSQCQGCESSALKQLFFFFFFFFFNPLNPGQFTRRVYRLPGAIRDNVPVSVSVLWQHKFQ